MPPRKLVLFLASILLLTSRMALAQADGGTALAPLTLQEVPEAQQLSEQDLAEEVVVTATRRPESIATIPGSITVVGGDALRQQLTSSGNNLGDALGKLVPGLALGNHSTSTYGQTMRGRNVLVMIDGIPQSAVRNVTHDLHAVSPEVIERVEVIRGTTAIYGEGAAGGIINLITRRTGSGPPSYSTTLQTSTAVVQPLDGLGGRVGQTANGSLGALSYSLAGSLEKMGGQFDAEGDRIPPNPYGQGGLADTLSWDLFAKVGYALGDQQRLRLTANHYQGAQDTRFTTDPTVNAVEPLGIKAQALEGLQMGQPEGTRNSNVAVLYDHDELFGSTLRAQAFFRNMWTNFFPFDGRSFAAYNAITQSRLESRKLGARLEVGTPLPLEFNVLWGLDAVQERTAQPVTLIDPAAYEESGHLSFQPLGDRDWVPPMDIGTLSAFAQLEWSAADWITLRGGVRQELIGLGVRDFTTLAGNEIVGADLGFASTKFNAGVIVAPTRSVQAYLNFSQGYALPDVGLILRNAPAGSTVETLNTAPQQVDLLELGTRLDFGGAGGSLVLFYNQSDLGTSSGGIGQPVVRAPERVYGVEATVVARPLEGLSLDASFTWLEGQLDRADDGNWSFLNGYRIPPPQWTLSASHQTLPKWRNEATLSISGSRRRFPSSTAFGERSVEPYATVDLSSTLEVGPGSATLAVTNLFNQQYFPRVSQMLYSGRNDSYSAARGAVATLSYTLRY